VERITTLIDRLIAPLRSAVADVVREELRRQHRAIIDAAAAEVLAVLEQLKREQERARRDRWALADARDELQAQERKIADLEGAGINERHKSARLAEELAKTQTELAKTQTELADATRAKPARVPRKPADTRRTVADINAEREAEHFAAVAPTKKTTAEVRADDTQAAKAVHCPECGVAPGDLCNDKGKRLPAMHPDRYALGRKRALELADGLSRACPECNAAAGTPCVVNGRRGLHNARKIPAPT